MDYKQNIDMELIRDDFLAQIRDRFSFILDINSTKFDRTFILAAFLDPNFCWLLDRADEYNALGLLKLSVK